VVSTSTVVYERLQLSEPHQQKLSVQVDSSALTCTEVYLGCKALYSARGSIGLNAQQQSADAEKYYISIRFPVLFCLSQRYSYRRRQFPKNK